MGRILLAVKQAHSEAKLLAPGTGYQKNRKMRMKVALIALAGLAAVSIGAPVPEADPEAFVNLGAVAIPAITGSALIDGLLLGYVAPQDDYGVPYEPPVNSYGAPAVSYEEPAPSYDAPSYEAPAPSYNAPAEAAPSYEAPAPAVADTYGSPAADPLPSYGAPPRY